MARPRLAISLLVLLAVCPGLLASGQFWDFLGYTQISGNADHMRIAVVRPGLAYRTIQMRVSDEAIFLDRLVLHFDGKGWQEITVNGRISPAAKSFLIQLPQDAPTLESVELWYYKESWGHVPRVSLYGLRKDAPESEPAAEREDNQ
jgi:hypothetical protein